MSRWPKERSAWSYNGPLNILCPNRREQGYVFTYPDDLMFGIALSSETRTIPGIVPPGGKHPPIRYQPAIYMAGKNIKLEKIKYDPCPTSVYCLNSSFRTSSRQVQSIEKTNHAKNPENKLQYSKINNFVVRISYALLRGKILYFTLFGFLLLSFGTLGLFWFFDDPNRNRKWHGALIAVTVLPGAMLVILYGLFG